MRLLKCKKLERYLVNNNFIDQRNIWCYAQMEAKLVKEKEFLYGAVLVCVNCDDFFVYIAEFNSTKIELFYTCKISEMENIIIKKKCLCTRVCFNIKEDWFQLDMDDWKRFMSVLE